MENCTGVAGIDLGTGNTVVVDTNGYVFLHNNGRDALFPSAVGWDKNGECVVGKEALDRRAEDGFECFTEFKRLIGKTVPEVRVRLPYEVVSDDAGAAGVRVGSVVVTPETLSESVVRHATKGRVKKCVVTCPAYFNDSQRRATRDAVERSGIRVLRLVNEPTAAACATDGCDAEETVMIFDVGSGTTDISIVSVARVDGDVVADVMATHGDTELGGIDIDAIIASKLDGVVSEQVKFGRANRIKHALTDVESFEGITRQDLEDMCSDLLRRMVQCVYTCMNNADLTSHDICRVVLVGGATRMPLIRNRLAQIFGAGKIDVSVNPDLAIAVGASNIARALDTGKGPLVLDLTPLTIGIEVAGGLVHPVIPRGSKVPCEFRSRFRPADKTDTVVDITIVEGERPIVSDCHHLGHLEFDLCEKLEVVLAVDVHGILTVSAVDLETGATKRSRVRAGRWSPDEVRRTINDAVDHAEEDERKKARNEALAVLDASLKNALSMGADIDVERTMKIAMGMRNGHDIRELVNSVNVSTTSFIPDIPSERGIP